MSFREKSAWISLFSIVLVSSIYFLQLPWPPTLRPQPNPAAIHALILCLILLVVIEVVAHVIIALRSPKEALTPKDERERLIALKAVNIAAHVYVVGTFFSVFLIHHGANAIAISNAVLFSFVLAEVVNYGARILYHRRGV